MPYIFKSYYSPRKLVFFFGEGLLIFLAVNSVALIYSQNGASTVELSLVLIKTLLFTGIFLLTFYFYDLYDLGEISSVPNIVSRVTQAFGVGCVILASIYYYFPLFNIPTTIFWPGLSAVGLSICLWRIVYDQVINKKMFVQSIIILGTGRMAHDIATELAKRRDSGFNIVHFIGVRSSSYLLPQKVPVTRDVSLLPKLCKQYNVERVVVAIDDRRGHTPIKELMECKFRGIPVEYGINFYEKLTGKIMVKEVNPDWFIFSKGFKKSRFTSKSKQMVESLVACLGLIVVSPIIALSCLLIKFESGGPVFYYQERVGLHGRIFKLIKLRSMYNDAEKDGPVWARADDERVTRYGRFMRKTRIDELPQLINVVLGHMSFVGPRPERPVFVDRLSQAIPYYSFRHNVKPGISGWAQICYPYGASADDALRKLEYDLYYIKYMSLQIDIWVMFQTVKIILFTKGAR